MQKVILVLITLTMINCSINKEAKQESSSNFNVEAINGYFIMVDKLLKDVDVENKDWDKFFNIEGNKSFFKENGIEDRKAALREAIEVTFTEKNDSIIEVLSNSNPNFIHQLRYKQNYEEVKKFGATLDKRPEDYKKAMLTLARKYLPDRMHKINPFPNIYFHALGEPSAGLKGMYLDILVEYDCNKELYASMGAHELHHKMRYSIIENIKADSIDKGILYLVDAVQNEGIADLVDKQHLLSEKSNWWMKEMFLPIIDMSPMVIQKIDSLIIKESKGKHYSIRDYRKTLLNASGHIPGYYMALQILEKGKGKELIENSDNPFLFFKLYNEAVTDLDNELPKFSKQSIDYIMNLNEKYKN